MTTFFRALVLALICAVVVASAIAGCAELNTQTVRGSGVVATETRDVSGFSGVQVTGHGNVVIEQTSTDSLSIEAEDNILPLLETTVENGVLHLRTKRGVSLQSTRPVHYRVTVKSLTGVGISGSGDVKATNVDTDRLAARITGSGSADLAGRADQLEVTIAGSGSWNAADLKSKTARVTISGSGDAAVNAADRLDATITGSGSVQYAGNPTVEKRITGSGSVSPE